jgi:hypothetical protein
LADSPEIFSEKFLAMRAITSHRRPSGNSLTTHSPGSHRLNAII